MVKKAAAWITKYPKKVVLIAVLLMIPSLIGMIFTPINYDLLSYLPKELDSVKGLEILDDELNLASMSIIVMNDMEWSETKNIEECIKEIEGVKSVLWLGALSNSKIPLSMFPESITSMLYSADGDSTLMMVQFNTSGASDETLDAIAKIQEILPERCLMSGTAAMTYDTSELIFQQMPIFVLIAVVLSLIALSLTMESFMLPGVMMIALGISILYNMGTNIILGQISFVTMAIAAILQMGVTMDYSIFLIDRYSEEKPKYRSRRAAMTKAITSTFASLAGSSLTTVFGFIALCFMSFTLGLDMGLVMAKGVIIGILSVVTILPALLLLFEKSIEKTKHKAIIPSFSGLNKVTLKARHVFSVIFILLLVPAWFGQNNVNMYYNMMKALPEDMEAIQAMSVLGEDFDMACMNMLLIDSELTDAQKVELSEKIAEIDGISNVMSMTAMMGTTISPDILPDAITSMLHSEDKELILINSVYFPASDECNAQVEAITSIAKSYDSEAYLTGEAAMYKDLIQITDRDFIITNAISIIAIFVLIAIVFKSLSIPFILVLAIELAIWINISISFLVGEETCFITPTIISCIQLGGTVDYAILLTTRFREEIRNGLEKKAAMKKAADSAHRSIFQSALVLFAVTIGVYAVCDIDIVRSMCAMLARGAVISSLVNMLFLTPLLVVCEGVIRKTTKNWHTAPSPVKTKKIKAVPLPAKENNEQPAEQNKLQTESFLFGREPEATALIPEEPVTEIVTQVVEPVAPAPVIRNTPIAKAGNKKRSDSSVTSEAQGDESV